MSKHRILIAIGVIVATIIGVGIVTGQGSSACVTGGAVPANNAALAADCDTLLGMKSALRGSGKLNWWTGRSIDKWDGITLGSGRVVQVSLPSKSLDGIIPAGFGNLSALQGLDLSSNSLTGSIPSELGNLTNLTRWRLSGNSLTGCVPANLSFVEDNDLDALGLSVCGGSAPAPTPISTPTPTPASSQPTTPPTDVSERLTAIENRLTTLERRVAALEGSAATPIPTPTQTPIPTTTPTPTPTATATPTADPRASSDVFVLTCPTRDEIEAVDKDLELSFINDVTMKRPLVCTEVQGSMDLTEVQWMAYQTLRIMKVAEFTEPLPWTGRDSLYEWFVGVVDGIDYDSTVDVSFCCRGGRIVISTKIDDVSGSMPSPIYWYRKHRAYPNFLAGPFIIDHIQLLVHEARHLEGFGHTCDDGVSDMTFEEMGSWACSAMVWWWFAEKFRPAGFFVPGEIRSMKAHLQSLCEVRFCDGSCPVWEEAFSAE